MKTILLTLFTIVLFSCSVDETNERLTYDYLPNQPVIIYVELIPVGSVKVEFKHMLEEVNADYYNRYGIGVNLVLKDRIEMGSMVDSGLFVAPTIIGKKFITVYLVKNKLIKKNGLAFATSNKNIVLGEMSQTSGALAHEIGHILGLPHVNDINNVMSPSFTSWQYDVPSSFNESQINTILNRIAEP